MGALHRGHTALMKEARRLAGSEGTVAVSIFVNPLQFDRSEDLDSYPHSKEKDLQACETAGVDIVFIPLAEQFYEPNHSIEIRETSLSKRLCGASRPGHFNGVCAVVLKLFMLASPQAALFGKKDFQQLAIIRRLARDLSLPTTIIGHDTVREDNGLALSSRNALLTEEEKKDAARLYRALQKAKSNALKGTAAHLVLKQTKEAIESSSYKVKIDYLELVNQETLEKVDSFSAPSLLALAVFYGDKVRLIDSMEIPSQK